MKNLKTKVVITQPLAHGKFLKKIYTLDRDSERPRYTVSFETNSSFDFCDKEGVFRKCAHCAHFRETKRVEKKYEEYIYFDCARESTVVGLEKLKDDIQVARETCKIEFYPKGR